MERFEGVLTCPVCGRYPRFRTAERPGAIPDNPLVVDAFQFRCCGLVAISEKSIDDAISGWNKLVKTNKNLRGCKEMDEKAEQIVKNILKRGNDVEIRSKKNGIQVIEVSKKTRYST